jgi:hypothetical protein
MAALFQGFGESGEETLAKHNAGPHRVEKSRSLASLSLCQ